MRYLLLLFTSVNNYSRLYIKSNPHLTICPVLDALLVLLVVYNNFHHFVVVAVALVALVLCSYRIPRMLSGLQ